MRTPEEKARSRCRKLSIIGGFVAIALGTGLFYMINRPQRFEVSGGTTLTWLGVTVGTNGYEYGTPLERFLGNRIPAKGFKIGAFKLRPPQVFAGGSEDAPITAWIRMDGSLAEAARLLSAGSKVFAANSSGRELENPLPRAYPAGSTNQLLFAVPLFAFPRDERVVRLMLSPLKEDW